MIGEVLPEPGEICSCGRPAAVVYVSDDFGRVGDCGIPNAAALEPCADPACEIEERGRHDRRWCTPERRALHKATWSRRLAELRGSLR